MSCFRFSFYGKSSQFICFNCIVFTTCFLLWLPQVSSHPLQASVQKLGKQTCPKFSNFFGLSTSDQGCCLDDKNDECAVELKGDENMVQHLMTLEAVKRKKRNRRRRDIRDASTLSEYVSLCHSEVAVIEPVYATSAKTHERVQLLQLPPFYTQQIVVHTCQEQDTPLLRGYCKQHYIWESVYVVVPSQSPNEEVAFKKEWILVGAGCDLAVLLEMMRLNGTYNLGKYLDDPPPGHNLSSSYLKSSYNFSTPEPYHYTVSALTTSPSNDMPSKPTSNTVESSTSMRTGQTSPQYVYTSTRAPIPYITSSKMPGYNVATGGPTTASIRQSYSQLPNNTNTGGAYRPAYEAAYQSTTNATSTVAPATGSIGSSESSNAIPYVRPMSTGYVPSSPRYYTSSMQTTIPTGSSSQGTSAVYVNTPTEEPPPMVTPYSELLSDLNITYPSSYTHSNSGHPIPPNDTPSTLTTASTTSETTTPVILNTTVTTTTPTTTPTTTTTSTTTPTTTTITTTSTTTTTPTTTTTTTTPTTTTTTTTPTTTTTTTTLTTTTATTTPITTTTTAVTSPSTTVYSRYTPPPMNNVTLPWYFSTNQPNDIPSSMTPANLVTTPEPVSTMPPPTTQFPIYSRPSVPNYNTTGSYVLNYTSATSSTVPNDVPSSSITTNGTTPATDTSVTTGTPTIPPMTPTVTVRPTLPTLGSTVTMSPTYPGSTLGTSALPYYIPKIPESNGTTFTAPPISSVQYGMNSSPNTVTIPTVTNSTGSPASYGTSPNTPYSSTNTSTVPTTNSTNYSYLPSAVNDTGASPTTYNYSSIYSTVTSAPNDAATTPTVPPYSSPYSNVSTLPNDATPTTPTDSSTHSTVPNVPNDSATTPIIPPYSPLYQTPSSSSNSTGTTASPSGNPPLIVTNNPGVYHLPYFPPYTSVTTRSPNSSASSPAPIYSTTNDPGSYSARSRSSEEHYRGLNPISETSSYNQAGGAPQISSGVNGQPSHIPRPPPTSPYDNIRRARLAWDPQDGHVSAPYARHEGDMPNQAYDIGMPIYSLRPDDPIQRLKYKDVKRK